MARETETERRHQMPDASHDQHVETQPTPAQSAGAHGHIPQVAGPSASDRAAQNAHTNGRLVSDLHCSPKSIFSTPMRS